MIRMSIKSIFILSALFLLVSSCRHSALSSSDPKPQTQPVAASSAGRKAETTEYVPSLKTEGAYVTVKDSNFSFAHKADEYARVVVAKEEKFVDSEPTPTGNCPAYRCFHLEDKR